MIQYNTKDWFDTFVKITISLHWGENYKVLIRAILMVLVYTSAITFLNITYFNIKFRIDPFFFSLLGLILSLFLVFRLNTSYAKWWEGRTLWGLLNNRTRTLSALISGILPRDDIESRQFFAKEIGNFAYALKGQLRDDMQYDNFDPTNDQYIAHLKSVLNIPQEIARSILEEVERQYKAGIFSDGDKINIKNEISVMLDIMGGCERIISTPIPFSHSSFFKSLIVIYIMSLPFGFVNSFLYFTIPATLLISYALLGVEIISEEIEDPFGKDPNDLPLTHMSNKMRGNVYALLGVKSSLPAIVEPVTGTRLFKIVH